ncbi:MAG: dihydrofolate reductase [Parcubacteria group bacterium]|nr:dihydrofolate reductase [Parcubacteria group bacterium]
MKRFSIVVAAAENRCIGNKGKIPWDIPDDLAHFRKLTMGHTVVMGRKTYESIVAKLGKPLPKRTNIVLAREKTFTAPGCTVVHSLDELFVLIKDVAKEVFVIGGGEIYKLLLPYVTRVYYTLVHAKPEGDAFFPELELSEWSVAYRAEFSNRYEKNEHKATLILYERKSPTKTADTASETFVDMTQLRQGQEDVYAQVKKDGVCPFCGEDNLRKYHREPIIREGEHWFVTKNDYPYWGTKLHFLFIHKEHITTLAEMRPQAFVELMEHVNWITATFGIPGATLVFRFGDTSHTCATVMHLHAHLIVGAPRTEGAQKIKVAAGYYEA